MLFCLYCHNICRMQSSTKIDQLVSEVLMSATESMDGWSHTTCVSLCIIIMKGESIAMEEETNEVRSKVQQTLVIRRF
jgi:hypothetical protein